MRQKTYSSLSFSFFLAFLRSTYTRTTIINYYKTIIKHNIDDQVAWAPQFNFCQPNSMCNPGKIKSFALKLLSRPSSNLLMNVMQQPGVDLLYGTLPEKALRWHDFLFGFHLYLARRCCENLPSAQGPTRLKSGPLNNMVSMPKHLLHHF